MSASIVATAPAGTEQDVSRARRGQRYFTAMAVMMVAVNLIGFAPSYFLKAHFDTPPLPLRTHFHGVFFSGWFVLYLLQTMLVSRGNVALHRRLGVAGGALALVMVTSGLAMLYYRALEVQLTGGHAMHSLIVTTTAVWANLALLAAFSLFGAMGIKLRRRPESHKRLMLLASISMMLQAIGRIGRYLPGSEVAWGLGGLVGLLASLVIFDLTSNRRLHPVTLIGPPLLFIVILLCSLVIPRTGIGQALIVALAS